MIRRVGEPVRADVRYRLRPGVYVILRRGDAVLLTHQAEPEPEVQLPGGGIDPGEGPLRALHREAMEETGWTLGRVRRLGAYRRFTYMPDYDLWAEKLCTVYMARPGQCLGPPIEAAHTPLWLPIDAAVEIVSSSGDRDMLKHVMALDLHP